MNHLINIILILSLSLSSIASINATTLPQPIRAEYFACKFDDGKDFSDLNKWIGKWNKWMDDSELSGYQANILTPLYRSPNDHHDFVLVGITDNAETMLNENRNTSNRVLELAGRPNLALLLLLPANIYSKIQKTGR